MKEQSLTGRVAVGISALGQRVGLEIRPSRLLSWGTKGTLAILDQGLFSGANFLVNILLARWLPPEEYGAFAVALSIFYLLAGFHTAVLTEPMMVFGAGNYREHFREYLGILLWGHWAISALIALVLGIAAFAMYLLGSVPMSRALTGLAIASPFLLLMWLARRAPYVEMRPQWAVIGSGMYLLVTLVGVFLLWRFGMLSSLWGLVIIGLAGAVASLELLLHIKPRLAGFVGNLTPTMVIADHRGYGGWAVGTIFLRWIPGNIAYTLLPIFVGLNGSGILRALMNLTLPLQQAISAISLLIVPRLSSAFTQREYRQAIYLKRLLLVLMVTISLLYGGIVALFRHELIHFLYKGRYDAFSDLVILVSFLPVVASLSAVQGSSLQALVKPNRIFQSYVFSSVLGTASGVLLIANFGVLGAVISLLVYGMSTIVALSYYLRLEIRRLVN